MWPDIEGLVIDAVDVVGEAVRIDLHAQHATVTYPSCGASASACIAGHMRRSADRPLGLLEDSAWGKAGTVVPSVALVASGIVNDAGQTPVRGRER